MERPVRVRGLQKPPATYWFIGSNRKWGTARQFECAILGALGCKSGEKGFGWATITMEIV